MPFTTAEKAEHMRLKRAAESGAAAHGFASTREWKKFKRRMGEDAVSVRALEMEHSKRIQIVPRGVTSLCCGKPHTNNMLQCCFCRTWSHLRCLLHMTKAEKDKCKAHKAKCVCRTCQLRLDQGALPSLSAGVFTYSSLFEGIGTDSIAIGEAVASLSVTEAFHSWSCEIDKDARRAAEEMNTYYPEMTAQTRFLDFLKIDWPMVPYTDVGVGGFPCIKFSPNQNGHEALVDTDDPTTKAMAIHLAAGLSARKWGFLLLECVSNFYHSNCWEIIKYAARQSGYNVKLHKVDTRSCKIPQSRIRTFACLTLWVPRWVNFKEQLDAALVNESKLEPKCLKSCLLSKSQLKKVGIDDSCALVNAKVDQSSIPWLRLREFFSNPDNNSKRNGLTLHEACRDGYVIDVMNSEDWIRLPCSAGCAPTVTGSHNQKALVLLQIPISECRYLLPGEHFLLQGFDLRHIKMISNAVGGSPTIMGRLAGNAIALPVMECFVTALSNTYPEVFKKRV